MTTKRRAGVVEVGARILPVKATLRVRVRRGRRARLLAAWGTIVNPGVVSPQANVTTVGGSADDPVSITLSSRPAGLHVGSVLSLAPTAQLRRGVLAKVTAITSAGSGVQVGLTGVSPFSVVPVAQFDVPLTLVGGGADHSSLSPDVVSVSCGGASPLTRTISDIAFSGGWATHNVLGLHLKTGVQAHIEINATAGLSTLDGVGYDDSCELDISADGAIGPIPVTAGVYGQLGGDFEAGLQLSSTASVHVDAGGQTVGVPPLFTWIPSLAFSSPSASLTATAVADASASVGVGVKAGLGEDDIAALTLKSSRSSLRAPSFCCMWAFHRVLWSGIPVCGCLVFAPSAPGLTLTRPRAEGRRCCGAGAECQTAATSLMREV